VGHLRIVQVITSTAERYGGPQRVVRDICEGLVARGHRVSLVTTDLDGPSRLRESDVRRAFGPDVDTSVSRTIWPRSYGLAPSLVSELRARIPQADLVHVHGVYQFHTVAACALARKYSIPYVVHVHGALTPYHRSKKQRKKRPYEVLIERRNLERAGATIVMTQAEKESFAAWLPSAPTVVVPPAIDSSLSRASDVRTGVLDQLSERAERRRLITFLGRLTEKKGLNVLLDAFGRLAGSHPDAHLVIAGPDDEGLGDELTREAARLGIGDRISLVGLVTGDAKRELLSASRVVALPSEDESFGVAIAEALAVGTPVVVTKEVALADDILREGAGKVVGREGAAFATAIAGLLADDAAWSEIAARGRRFAERLFAGEAVMTRLERVYREVCDQGKAIEPTVDTRTSGRCSPAGLRAGSPT
jgi:glycosyltransferase involved in cell wall biosynthesis